MLPKPNHNFCKAESVFKQAWRECWRRIFAFRTFKTSLGSPWSQQFFLHAVSSPSFLLPVIRLILYLLVTAPRTRIPHVRDMSVSCCANLSWKLLLAAWQTEGQVLPASQLGSHILTYHCGIQLKQSAFCCYLNIQIIRTD